MAPPTTTAGLGIPRLKPLNADTWFSPRWGDQNDHRSVTGTPLARSDSISLDGSPPAKPTTVEGYSNVSSSQQPKLAEEEQNTRKSYYICNVQTGDYAALLNDSDRCEIVNANDTDNPGSEWFIVHLRRDEYRLQNSAFESFACYDNRPELGSRVLGKWDKPNVKPSIWRIRSIPGPEAVYTISPLEDPDIFWMSVSNVEGTPLELGTPWTARTCQWVFKAVASNTGSSPIISYEETCHHVLITQLLLEKLPNVDPDSFGWAFDVARIVLEITKLMKSDLDAVERKIVSTAAQLVTAHDALVESKSSHSEDGQWTGQFRRTLKEELGKLYGLREESVARQEPDPEGDRKRISQIFEHMNEARMQFELAIGIRVFRSLYEMEGSVRKSLLNDLKPSAIADHKYYFEGEEGKLLLRTVCTFGTRVHILDNVINWAQDTSKDNASVYWLFGPAGSGKSTVTYTVARRFEFAGELNGTIILGGNFFCSRQFEETKQAKHIIRTIAYHLALVCKPFADALGHSAAFDKINHDIKSQIQHLLVKPWQASEAARVADPSLPPHYLLVIDALDEIDGKGGSNFLRDLFTVFNQNQLRGLKLFATSRPDPELVKMVDDLGRKEVYRLQDVEKEEVQDDIKTYLTAVLPYFADRTEISRLVAMADGLFIYAATVVRYLEGYEPSEQERLLRRILSSQELVIPKRSGDSPLLDKLYRQILVYAFRDLDDEIRVTRLEVLYTFLCTAERTSEQVVADLLCTQGGDEPYLQCAAAVLKGLHSVLYVQGGRVLSYHKSFPDFLFNQTRSQEFWCDQAVQHRVLTRSCFRTMNAGLKFNIANIQSSYILDCDNPELREEMKQNIPDVLSYSSRHWCHHLCLATAAVTDPQYLCLSEFLHIQALFWVEAMNLLELRGQCDLMLRKVADWVKRVDLTLADRCNEAANFCIYFSGSAASSSTPHLYLSSLATWPGNAEPCQGWKRLFPRIPTFSSALDGRSRVLMKLGCYDPARSVGCSSDDTRIVSTGSFIFLWDASTGQMLNMVTEYNPYIIHSVSLSPDGKRIASGSTDKTVRVWDADLYEGNMLALMNGHTDAVNSVAFSSDGSRIVSGSSDRSVRVWNASTGELIEVLNGHSQSVNSVALSGDGSQIVSGSTDRTVRVWNVLGTPRVLHGHAELVISVAFSPNGGQVASGSGDKTVRVWNPLTGDLLNVLNGHTDGVRSVAFSPDGNLIVSASGDKSVRSWDAYTGGLRQVLIGHTQAVTSAVFSSDGNRIISGSLDTCIYIWDASTGIIPYVSDDHLSSVLTVAFSHDGSWIVSGSYNSSVRVWSSVTGELLKELHGHTDRVNSVAFSSDGGLVVSGSSDRSVRLWSSSTGESLKVMDGHTDQINSVAISSDGSQIASGSSDSSVRVWDVPTGKLFEVLDGHTRAVNSVDFSSDGSQIVSGSGDNSVRVWNAKTGESLKTLHGHTDQVKSVKFSNDGNLIVSGSLDESIRVWSSSTGESLNEIRGYTEGVNSVAFSSDGSRIISGSRDKSVRVWSASTGQLLTMLDDHTGAVVAVALSKDDSRIVSISVDDSDAMRVWDISAAPRYLRQHDDVLNWQREYKGWILSPSGEDRLMFIPLEANLADSSMVLSIPGSIASSVDFTHAALGLEWHNCYSP